MDRPDVWFVAADGSNTEWLAHDALEQIVAQGLPWFEELADVDRAIEIFATRESMSLAPGISGDFYGGRARDRPIGWRRLRRFRLLDEALAGQRAAVQVEKPRAQARSGADELEELIRFERQEHAIGGGGDGGRPR